MRKRLFFAKALVIIAVITSGCSGEQFNPYTTEYQRKSTAPSTDVETEQTADQTTSTPATSPATRAVPINWPKCWKSARLATAEAMRIIGQQADGAIGNPVYQGKKDLYGFSKQDNYRHEFKGQVKNPDTAGNCVLNWLVAGHTHTKETWISNHPASHSFTGTKVNYSGVVSCMADTTPDCTCVSGFADPSVDNTRTVSSQLCVRGNQLFHSNDMGGTSIAQLTGAELTECQNISKSAIYAEQTFGGDDYTAKSDHTNTSVNKYGFEVACRLDIEPFAPDAMEKDWYAHATTNWGALTCYKKGVDLTAKHCRCYILKQKSYFQDNVRSTTYQSHTCLQCDGNSCKAVGNISD